MATRDEDWPADRTGPVVRPYALTAGRTRPSGASIDLVAAVLATRQDHPAVDLEPEHLRLLRLCRTPVSVADVASDLDLPLGVVRILIADLRDRGLLEVHAPVSGPVNDVRILREVADALRRL